MAGFDPKAFGVRLTTEMERAGFDVKALRERIVAASGKARGTSYASVWGYVKGQAALEPRREVVEALAGVFGVLPSFLTNGGPRTKEEERQAAGAKKDSDENFTETLISEALPEYVELEFDSKALLVRAVVRFEAASPRAWFPPNNKTKAYAAHLVAFMAILRQSVFMPLWAWGNTPDFSDTAVRDYVRAALTAFVLSIPKRVSSPPLYRLETYHGSSPTKPHEEADWARWATSIHSLSESTLPTREARRKKATAKTSGAKKK